MKNQHKTIYGRSVLAHLFAHPVENGAIIDEEENGFGLHLYNRHVTEIQDQEVLNRIIKTSIFEIIS